MGKASRDKRDIFYRLAKEQGWRARSAFKLLQIDEEFHVLEGVKNVVDLCAAPGGWSQVLSKKLENVDAKIVAVDLQMMSPLEGVVQIQGDITNITTANEIIAHFNGGQADLVICDGAPDVIGLYEFDEYIQAQLVLASLSINTHILKAGGSFIAKIYRAKHLYLLYSQLSVFFRNIIITKPRCSRNTSRESFIYCQGFRLPIDFHANRFQSILEEKAKEYFANLHSEDQSIDFVACGPLNGLDADRNYSLENSSNTSKYEYRAPIQMPIRPPYEQSNLLRKNNEFVRHIGN